jgi:hypothetical protein
VILGEGEATRGLDEDYRTLAGATEVAPMGGRGGADALAALGFGVTGSDGGSTEED